MRAKASNQQWDRRAVAAFLRLSDRLSKGWNPSACQKSRTGRTCRSWIYGQTFQAPGGVVIRVLLVEDHELVRDALAAFLRKAPNVEVVAAVSSVRETLPLLESLGPDIVLADLSLLDGSAMEILRAVKEGHHGARVIVMTGFPGQFAAMEALSRGAAGYVLKSQASADVLDALCVVARGERYLAPEITAKLPVRSASKTEANRNKQRKGLAALTRREREIFLRVVEGVALQEIADHLGISPKTVETHRRRIQRKLALHTAADFVRFAIAHRIPGQLPDDHAETPARLHVADGDAAVPAPGAAESTLSTRR
jgi:two-component system response regulator NreC